MTFRSAIENFIVGCIQGAGIMTAITFWAWISL